MKKMTFTDIVLAVLAIGTVAFTVAVLIIFARIGEEPSTLISSFFALIGAEAAICWQIWAKKNKMDIKTNASGAADILEDLDVLCDPNEEDEGEG